MTRTIFCLLIVLLFASCIYKGGFKDKRWDTAKVTFIEKPLHTDIADLKNEKKRIDSLAADTTQLIVMVKVPGKEEPIKVVNDKYPDGFEIAYNFLMTHDGKIIYAVEIPTSESGDWFIYYRSYFDSNGQLVAFERQGNFFNSGCTKEGDVAYENSVKYYTGLNIVDSTYRLTDIDHKPLTKSKCTFYYSHPYKVITDIDSYLSDHHIHKVY